MERRPLLIEIGVEELPALPLLRELPHIPTKWKKILRENRLPEECDFFYTPRRLVLWHEALPLRQPASYREYFGPPLSIAFRDGEPTRAALGFAKKVGRPLEELSRAVKKGEEVLYYREEREGAPLEEILPSMVEEWLHSLDFGKKMRWGAGREEFIRPIRWIILNFGEEFIESELFGVTSANRTYLHRSVSMEPVEVANGRDYFRKLQEGGVILSQEERAERIEAGFQRIEEEGGRIERDRELFQEVVAITEYPTPLKGSFDPRFLQLPKEVLITSMKEHQRYFPIFRGEELENSFVLVSNAYTEEFNQIVTGNERVLKARFNDAMFFWQNDLKRGLDFEGLKEIVFMEGLGSLFDKELRELKVAEILLEEYREQMERELSKGGGELRALLERAIMLSKADLLTEMVYEFPELQGIMGYYYALAQGEDGLVALAIKEQYLPKGEESSLPSNLFTSLVALAVKIDTLLSLFSIGKVPTGSKDPFGLRRAAIGIIKIAIEKGLSFDISAWDRFRGEYREVNSERIEQFFIERLYQLFETNPSIVAAVIASGERDLVEIARKVEALSEIVGSPEFKEIFTTFKRVANIVKDLEGEEIQVDPALFQEREERELWEAFQRVRSQEYGSYRERLEALFALKPSIDSFFDNVLVNVDDSGLRRNRKGIIASIYNEFKKIADIKEISV
ncbi:MAG: glycine--tRNA ligase subunit beta [Epsilonproteobacteria bacterium]|nr:glycine--tRNA ligase subunit beta [Campylobacterota bacterium]NPA57199.1 glycine--tRNA ligase subunit beta [Campylobacterota bacterium]